MPRKMMNTEWLQVGTLLLLFVSLSMLAPAETRALDSYWIGGPGDWNHAGNWNPGIPVTGSRAVIGDDGTGSNWSAEVSHTITPTYPGGAPYAECLAGVNITARSGNTVRLYHSGGTLTLGTDSSLTITAFNGATAGYYLSQDPLLEDAQLIKQGYEVKVGTGLDSSGYFEQTGGVFQLNGAMYVGDGEFGSASSNSSGLYNMYDGIITGWTDGEGITHYGSITLGEWGATGTFLQSGGSVSIRDLNLARQVGSQGDYALYNGILDVSGLATIGQAGTGTFSQTGGTVNAASLIVGGSQLLGWDGATGRYTASTGGTGTYTLNASMPGDGSSNLFVSNDLVVGEGGQGTFNHESGRVAVQSNLILGTVAFDDDDALRLYGTGAYNLEAGELLVLGNEYVGLSGTGTFEQWGGTHTIVGNLYIGDTSTGNGTFNLKGGSGGATLQVNDSMVIGSSSGGRARFTQQDNSEVRVKNTVQVGSPSSATINGTYDMQGGTLTAGTIEVTQGGRFIRSGGSVDADEIVNNGLFTGDLTNHGVMSGMGTFTGNVTNYGTIAPGASPGTLTIDGNLAMDSASILDIELGGGEQGLAYDLLRVTGDATLAGILNVNLWDGFSPTAGEYFDILTAAVISGSFSLGSTPSGWVWDLAYLDLSGDSHFDTVRLTANAVPIPGALWLFGPALLGLAGLRKRSVK